MTTLAQEFGISDHGLAKACAGYRIPVPPRGDWAKVVAADQPQIPPFLEMKNRSLDRLSSRGATASFPGSVADLACKRKTERDSQGAAIRPRRDMPLPMVDAPHAGCALSEIFGQMTA